MPMPRTLPTPRAVWESVASLVAVQTDRPGVAIAFLGSVAALVAAHTARRLRHVRRRAAAARAEHGRRTRLWIADQAAQATLRRAVGEGGEFEADVAGAYELWAKGVDLGCAPQDLHDVTETLVAPLKEGLAECLAKLHENWASRQRLMAIMERVEGMGLQRRVGDVWPAAAAARRRVWRENGWQLVRVMSRTAGSRACRLVVTVGVAYLADVVSSASSEVPLCRGQRHCPVALPLLRRPAPSSSTHNPLPAGQAAASWPVRVAPWPTG